jgi:hypothetical protein
MSGPDPNKALEANMMKALAVPAVALAVMLGGCSESDADREADKKIDDLVSSTKTCGDYAMLGAQSNCIRFVEEQRQNNSAFGKHAGQLVKALDAHWNKSCADRAQDIETLQLKTTIALTRNGPIDPKANSVDICQAQVEEGLKAYPALANDRSSGFR